jgi:hypothetical protein
MDTLEKHIAASIAAGRSVPPSIAERARDVIEFEALMKQRRFNRNWMIAGAALLALSICLLATMPV